MFTNSWLLLGVEDTADVEQSKIDSKKNEENNENNRFVKWRSTVTSSVSSTSRRCSTHCQPLVSRFALRPSTYGQTRMSSKKAICPLAIFARQE